jgi:hypothetical protein
MSIDAVGPLVQPDGVIAGTSARLESSDPDTAQLELENGVILLEAEQSHGEGFRSEHLLDLLRREVGAQALCMGDLQPELALIPAKQMVLDQIFSGLLVKALPVADLTSDVGMSRAQVSALALGVPLCS